MELEQSRKTMKEPWNPAGWPKIFCKRFNEVVIFTTFAENNISSGDTINLPPTSFSI